MGVHYGKADFITYGKPSLFLDFANKKSLVDRISGNNLITFNRTSSATYVGADGLIKSAAVNEARFDHNPVTGESLGLLIEEERINLVTRSEDFSDAIWTKNNITVTPNIEIAPDGTITADKITANTGATSWYMLQTLGSSPSTSSCSVYAKASGWNFVSVGRGFVFGSGDYAIFNLQTGVISRSPTFAGSTASITYVGNGWYRCTLLSSQTENRFHVTPQGIGSSVNGDTPNGTNGIYIWGAQLEAGAFPTSYIPTPATFTGRTSTATFYDSAGIIQTAASGVARSNAFFPDSSGVMRPAGLLLEAAGTNLVTYSEQFGNADWVKTNAAVTSNASTSPDGTLTADLLYTTTTGVANAGRTIGSVSSAPYTASIYLKSSGLTWAFVYGAQGNNKAFFNLATGTVGTLDAGLTASISSVGNGWYRCSVTQTITNTNFYVGPADSNGSTTSTASGTSGILVWGAQLETGTYPTSYIPTVASTVPRSADTSTSETVTRYADFASITGTNFSSWYNASENTICCQGISASRNNSGYYALQGGGSNGSSVIVFPANTITWQVYNTSFQVNTTLSSYNSVSNVKSAVAMKSNNFAGVVNGGSIITVNSGTVPAVTSLVIGNYLNGGTSFDYTGTISRLVYYPTRLTDTQLQNLTK